MSYILETWKDPFGEGFSICENRTIELKEGLTVLVGCNGIGKSTTLHNLEESLKKDKMPYLVHDNLHEHGGSAALGRAMYADNFTLGATLMTSSEGECITANLGTTVGQLHDFLVTGMTDEAKRVARLQSAVKNIIDDHEYETESPLPNNRFILMDAIDSGYSIDNVIALKDVLRMVIEDGQAMGNHMYVVASANEYELASGEQCLDVTTGSYLTFSNYEDYKEFIIKSSRKKESRYKKKKPVKRKDRREVWERCKLDQ